MGEVTYEMKIDETDPSTWKYLLYRHEEFVHSNGGRTLITDLIGAYPSLDGASIELRRQQRLDLAKQKK